MSLPLRFAIRYLFARKKHNVINMISGIGVAGMAIGTAALVIILSVFNGFNDLISSSLEASDPDFVIKPKTGKFFTPDRDVYAPILEDERVVRLSSVLEEQVFLSYESRQSIARIKGVDEGYQEESPLKEHIIDGTWSFHRGDLPTCVSGASLAQSIGINPRFVTPLEIYYPTRKVNISLANPQGSLRKVKVRCAGVISVNQEVDSKVMLVPIECMRELLECPTEVSSIEIWAKAPNMDRLEKDLGKIIGPDFKVLNRYSQQESLFKMMKYEKLSIFIILMFVVIIIAFNIFSSLKMLIIEKEEDISTLRSLGANDLLIKKIFLLEGYLVSLSGMALGLLIGVVAVWAQQQFGFVGMPGNFVVNAYPVHLHLIDIIFIATGVSIIGYLMAYLPSRRL